MSEASALPPDVWDDFRTRLTGYVRRRVDPASADDIVATVLLRLIRHRDALAAADNPTAWMLRVAANAVADHHRRRATELRALEALAAETAGDAAATEASATEADSEFAQCLVPFIRELPAAYGQALMLADIEGLTRAETAKRLGLSLSGAKSRIRRGRALLRQALLRCCAVETDRWGTVLDYRSRNRQQPCSGGR